MSSIARNQVFSAVHTVGALLPSDMLARISEGKDIPGATPADYQVFGARSVRDEAERHWDYLKSIWKDLRAALPPAPGGDLPGDPTGRALTQWLEPLFAELGFGRLRALYTTGITSDDNTKTFAVSHRWEHVPVHLTGWQTVLDKRPAPGTVPPQSLVQECLNRTATHLWAIVSNGRQLRLLRDSTALAGAAYVEFDLEAIFDGELFSEFVLLYRLLHASRFDVPEGAAPSACWLEKWRGEAITSGTRALEQLRLGVQNAITTLGTGFLRHPANRELRENLDVPTYHTALLRLVYRLLFLFVAEDRDALLHPDAPEPAKERYTAYYSTARLRRTAQRRHGTAHTDLYQALRLVLAGLSRDDGRPELALPGLGGLFDDTETDKVLHELALSNEALLTAVRSLCVVRDTGAKRNRVVDYRHLDAEELGSIYESLLELVPKHDASARTFELVELAGNSRKTTGSYYTPSSLIDCLLDTALDPVIDDAVKRGELHATRAGHIDPTSAIVNELLSLTVCDPACGSGHFLVAAARRIAKRVAAIREQNPEPTLDAVRTALHEVVARCIYGVDLNPMAVDLAKVSLWLEALEPGKPLGFLDAHIKHGNGLIGATPALLAKGIPDDAFKAIEGDDPKFVTALKKINVTERSGQDSLFDIETEVKVANTAFANGLRRITTAKADTLRDVRLQSTAFRKWEQAADYVRALHVADAWCAAFVWTKTQGAPRAVTDGIFRKLEDPDAAGASAATNAEIIRLREQYRFFHWHLEFPDVFHVAAAPGPGGDADVDERTGWSGGFSCVLGNPPWERIKLQEQEFFAQRDVEIATAPNAAARKKLIAALSATHPELADEFNAAKRRAEGESHFLRSSRRYPLTGHGDINTYAVFAETDRALIEAHGRLGVIVPTGVATDATTQHFFRELVEAKNLASLFDFENEDKVFANVHNQFRFCLLTINGRGEHAEQIRLVFKIRQADQVPLRRYELLAEEILLLNPNTGTIPTFRSRRDADITTGIYRRVPVLIREGEEQGNPWGISFMRMFDMSNDSRLFHTREQLETEGWVLDGNIFEHGNAQMLPLYEAKMAHHYDHRFSTYERATQEQLNKGTLPRLTPEQHGDSGYVVQPRYWVAEEEVSKQLVGKRWNHGWLLGWRDICRSSDERTMISAVFPRVAVGHKMPLVMPNRDGNLVAAIWSSFVFDYIARQKIGGTSMTYFYLKQFPMLPPEQVELYRAFITPRVLELIYTAHDMEPFARELDDFGEPFRWDEERRFLLRAELDALFFRLYGINRDDVDYIMETFPIVKRKDIAAHGSYRTKDRILAIYDAMAAADAAGAEYQTILDPPLGFGPRHPVRGETQRE